MYSDLPNNLQKKVCVHLANNDFKSAKQLHDQWMRQYQEEFLRNRQKISAVL